MKSEDYLTINPMGKVAALVHDGKVMTETAAIITILPMFFQMPSLLQKIVPNIIAGYFVNGALEPWSRHSWHIA
nr:glutathione S-transferase N-terminal domain-containing protein [uncultured Bartonella sp.]